jgi:hypothetical protein
LPKACLHWGLLAGKHYLNPLTLIPDRPVRLLPLTEQQPARAPSPAPPAPRTADGSAAPPGSNQRTAKLIIAATAALTLTAGLLIRRE